MRRTSKRVFLIDKNGPKRIKRTVYERLQVGKEKLPQYANQKMQCVVVHLHLINKKPAGIESVAHDYLVFDNDGALDVKHKENRKTFLNKLLMDCLKKSGDENNLDWLQEIPIIRKPKKKYNRQKYPLQYDVWRTIRTRCSNPNNKHYYLYGGRGIKVCERWNTYKQFYADVGPQPSPEHTLKRNNKSKNYTPSNCRWAIKRRTLTVNGRTQTIKAWARETKMTTDTIRSRIKKGWSDKRVVTTPAGLCFEPGSRFGHEYKEHHNYRRFFVCRCSCGSEHVVNGSTLRHGTSKSCRSCAQLQRRKKEVLENTEA